jgi:hypothetical protein
MKLRIAINCIGKDLAFYVIITKLNNVEEWKTFGSFKGNGKWFGKRKIPINSLILIHLCDDIVSYDSIIRSKYI